MRSAKLIRPIEITGSQIEGAITLDHAHTDSLIVFDGSLMASTAEWFILERKKW
jgi:hypothetical protein